MLFRPKYGRDWTRFLAIGFYTASIGFAISAIASIFSHFDDPSDKVFAVSMFSVGALIWGALGRFQWKIAAAMKVDQRRDR